MGFWSRVEGLGVQGLGWLSVRVSGFRRFGGESGLELWV